MKLRTVTRQNGRENEREMHFGLDVIGTVGAIIGAGFAAWLSLRMDVKAIQTQQIDDTLHLPVVIHDAIETHDDLKQYVTRDDLDRTIRPR